MCKIAVYNLRFFPLYLIEKGYVLMLFASMCNLAAIAPAISLARYLVDLFGRNITYLIDLLATQIYT